MKIFKNRRGFTLVELIVVLVILAILASLLIIDLLLLRRRKSSLRNWSVIFRRTRTLSRN